ncbi:MAG: M12 family metallo-peptidase [Gammaproteobacteria bacterium]
MKWIRHCLIVSAVIAHTPALAQQASIAHFEFIEDLRTAARLATDGPQVTGLTASFSAFGKTFDLALESNRRIESILGVVPSDARAYRGQLREVPGSWVRVVLSGNGLSGLIWDGTTLYGVETHPGAASTIFRADDVLIPAGTMSCAMHAPAADAAAMFAELSMPETARAAGATLNLNLGIASDPEFGTLYTDPEAAMLIRVNNVDGIYSEQLGVQISVQRVDVFDDPATDPFTDTTDAEDLLDELAVFRGNTPEQNAQGLTHLFTGRDLGGAGDSTVGIAYVDTVCAMQQFAPDGASFGVGLTQAAFGPGAAMVESLIAAHEIGHNFGAQHDGEESACDAPSTGFIMAASLDPFASEFSQCSIDVITANLPSATCLTTVANVDAGIDGQSSVATPLAETQFDYVVSVTNQGEETAAATSVQLDFDPALSVLSVTPQSGTCGPALSSVSCDLGDIPGSSTRTVTIALQADASGNVSISGTVTSADDVNASNDAFADTVTIAAASDLALFTSAQTLTQNVADTIVATLENRSGGEASNISLTGTLSNGLQIDRVSFAGSACTAAGDLLSFDCRIASLAGLSSGELSIGLTGIETGSEVITLNVSAQESDPNAANNSSNLAIEVIAAAPPSSGGGSAAQGSGGGGSLSPLALLALLGAWRHSHRRKRRGKANFS